MFAETTNPHKDEDSNILTYLDADVCCCNASADIQSTLEKSRTYGTERHA